MNKGGPGSVEALLRVNNLKKYSTNIETEELTIETCAALGTYRQRQQQQPCRSRLGDTEQLYATTTAPSALRLVGIPLGVAVQIVEVRMSTTTYTVAIMFPCPIAIDTVTNDQFCPYATVMQEALKAACCI